MDSETRDVKNYGCVDLQHLPKQIVGKLPHHYKPNTVQRASGFFSGNKAAGTPPSASYQANSGVSYDNRMG